MESLYSKKKARGLGQFRKQCVPLLWRAEAREVGQGDGLYGAASSRALSKPDHTISQAGV